MALESQDWQALFLSVQVAALTTLLLAVLTTPIAWWLARLNSPIKPVLSALIAMPLVLPPTVLGFYLLLLLSPQHVSGQWLSQLGLGQWLFSFKGIVLASFFYSLPFYMQPMMQAFENISEKQLQLAQTFGANSFDRFFSVVLPQSKRGFITAGILAFTHTIGEFGVILMVGGNIAGETKLVSVQIYEHVELFQLEQAHSLSLVMIVFALLALMLTYSFGLKKSYRWV